MAIRKIIFTRPDGGVSVVHPVRNTHPQPEVLTDAEIEQRSFDKLPADAIDPRFVDASAVPADRTFRNAWVANGSGIAHDMARAREIKRDELRALRAPLLAKLDVAYMRADEAGNAAEKTRIVAQKQALRDATADPAIDAAQTPEALKRAMPAALA